MKHYTKYDPETGRILSTGVCQDEVFYFMFYVIEGKFDDTKYYIDDYEPVEYPARPSEFHVFDYASKTWTLSSEAFEGARAKKSVSLDADCKQSIVSGFYSSALGIEHFYPSKVTDQANLNASVTSSFYPNLPEDWSTPFWCSVNGDWKYVNHTAEQIQQVGLDGKNTILGYLAKNELLHAQLQLVTTLEGIEAIQW